MVPQQQTKTQTYINTMAKPVKLCQKGERWRNSGSVRKQGVVDGYIVEDKTYGEGMGPCG